MKRITFIMMFLLCLVGHLFAGTTVTLSSSTDGWAALKSSVGATTGSTLTQSPITFTVQGGASGDVEQ